MVTTFRRVSWLLVVAVIAVGIWAITPAPAIQGTHFTEHKEHNSALRNCTPDNPTTIQYYNPQTQRYSYVCQDDNGNWLVVVFCAITGAIITAFCKNKLKRREQVDQYMRNVGYRQ